MTNHFSLSHGTGYLSFQFTFRSLTSFPVIWFYLLPSLCTFSGNSPYRWIWISDSSDDMDDISKLSINSEHLDSAVAAAAAPNVYKNFSILSPKQVSSFSFSTLWFSIFYPDHMFHAILSFVSDGWLFFCRCIILLMFYIDFCSLRPIVCICVGGVGEDVGRDRAEPFVWALAWTRCRWWWEACLLWSGVRILLCVFFF